MQQSVLMGMLLTLLNKKKVTRQYLSEKYEVSTRTVVRYIDVLNAAGVPIISYLGKNGGYGIYDDYRLDRNYFSKAEKERLINSLNATKAAFGDEISKQLLDKLTNTLTTEKDEQYFLKTDTLIIDGGSWTNPQIYRNKITTINEAITNDTSLEIEYTDKHSLHTKRIFDPYSVVLKEGVWYVYGFCNVRNDFRLLKLSRIKTLKFTEIKFTRKEYDIYSKLHGTFEYNNEIDLVIEFSCLRLNDIEEWLGADSIRERGLQYVAAATVYSGNQLLAKLLSFGSDVKVLSPTFLKEEIMLECKRILEQ